jgi:threonyl-tRNA synthetase
VRLAEFGTVYRWEQSGEIGGMTRVRGFTQDDAHLFCTEEQVAEELQGCLELVKIIFKTLGMKDYRVRVGLRDPDSAKYVGDPKNWDKAEQACRDAAKPRRALQRGARRGRVLRPEDRLRRQGCHRPRVAARHRAGRLQPAERFDLEYIGADNQPHRPVMIHRAPFGSFERFIGVPDRALRRRVPDLAQPRAGPRPDDQRKEPQIAVGMGK